MAHDPLRGLLGLERRGLWATARVAAVILVYAAGLPLVDAVLDPAEAGVPAGAQMVVPAAPGAGAGSADHVRFTPATGWVLESDERIGRRTLSHEGITLVLDVRSTGGDSHAVLAAAERAVDREHDGVAFNAEQSFPTTAGVVGLSASFVGRGVTGLSYAFESRGVGVSLTAVGPAAALLGSSADVVADMARTVTIR
jgi:hypothetical protein